ncbi:hypothetical protein [Azospirillum sp.]|uniref:hypothetical protein n=1 Tax=Azospirillum sp. TaxID=34012 RepID=UPI003D719344
MANSSFSKNDRVTFRPGPRARADVSGSVVSVDTTGEGRGRATWLTVKCDDGETRKVRPGACRAA